MSREDKNPKIAVIGPSQSGKTCLAVGLFSTSTGGFTIDVPNVHDRNYLAERRKEIVGGTWPDATNKGTWQNIRFDFHKKRKPDVKVEFMEFAGEILADDESFRRFANEHFTNLNGVVLLVNPGIDAFQSGDVNLLEDVKAQYNRILSFLHDPNNNSSDAFVALAVTAADRLDADLRGKDEAFRDCLDEIMNALSSRNFRWRGKPFYISMSGRTGSGNKFERKSVPKGWPNTTSRPFLWILDRLGWQSMWTVSAKRWIKYCGIAAAAACFACGAWYYFAHESERREIESRFNEASDRLDRADRAGVATRDLENAFNVSKDAIRELGKARFCRSLAERRRGELEPKADRVLGRLIDGKCDGLKMLAGKHGDRERGDLDDLYLEYRTYAAGSHSSNTVARLGELAVRLDRRMREEWEWKIDSFGETARTNATASAVQTLREQVEAWEPATAKAAADKASLLSRVVNSMPEWRAACEVATFGMKIDSAVKSGELERLAALHPLRVATNDYLTSEYVSTQWKGKVKPEYDKALERYVGNALAAIDNRRGRPVLTDRERDGIAEMGRRVGEPFDSKSVLEEILRKVDAKAVQWDESRRGECNEWVRREIRPGRDRVGQLGLWSAYEKAARGDLFKDNPFFDEIVRAAVYREAEKWLEADVAAFRDALAPSEGESLWEDGDNMPVRYRRLDETFQEFKKLCRRITDDKHPFAGSWAFRFAELCRIEGHVDDGIEKAFPQRIVARRLEAEIDYKGNYPTAYWGTAFAAWFEVHPINGDGTVGDGMQSYDLIAVNGSGHAPKGEQRINVLDAENPSKEIWSGEKICTSGLFQRCRFMVKATDYNKANLYKYDGIMSCVVPFATKTPIPRLAGELDVKRITGKVDGSTIKGICAALTADMDGETPFSLLEQAKRGVKGNK